MKRKISLLLLLALPFVAVADWWARYSYYPSNSRTVTLSTWNKYSSYEDAVSRALYQIPIISYPDLNYSLSLVSAASNKVVSNDVDNTVYHLSQLPKVQSIVSELHAVHSLWIRDHSLFYQYPFTPNVYTNGGAVYWTNFNPQQYLSEIYQRASFVQLQSIIRALSTVDNIGSDVSTLVPLVESNKMINAGIASTVAGLGGVTNQLQSVLNNRLFGYTVDYDIPQIRDAVGGFRLLDPEQPTGDNTALMTYYYALRGLDFLDDQPGMVAQMVTDGFATSAADATAKLTSNTFRASMLGPAVSQMRAKRDAIAKLKAAGMSAPPGGGSFDDMNLGELETLYQYSYNTPVSSNATVQAHALDQLKEINSEVTDAAGILSDIRNEVTGPQEVEVLNWPDDFNGLSVTLSNAFAEALANLDLNVSSEVWQLGRDYDEYRTYAAGVNPSYNAFFDDASFLAAPGPNDGKWWTESQNLLAYIAYYTASNRSLSAGILAELTTNAEWIAASLSAASNNLAAIWGDNPRGWLDSKLSELQSGQTQLLDNFNSLTYFEGVGDIIDTYYQDVQQVPDTISFNTPFPISPSIDLRRMRGFLDLLHAATTLFLIGGWLICVPYIARWMFEHVNRMFDLFKQ